jgi:radical SAM-linked protein
LHEQWSPPIIRTIPQEPDTAAGKYRVSFTKLGKARYLSHLEMVRLFARAFRRAGLELVHSAGYHPMPKLSFHSALPVGVESLDECLDIRLRKSMSPSIIQERLNPVLPSGIRIVGVQDVTQEKKRPQLRESHFRMILDGLNPSDRDLQRFMKSDFVPALKKVKGSEIILNARGPVLSMEWTSPHEISLVISHDSGPQLRPTEILQTACGIGDGEAKRIRVLKTRQVLS